MEVEFAKAAKREKDAAAKRKKDIQQAIEVVLASLAGVLLLGLVGFGIYQLRDHG
jgi:preprotein translocase subunit Sss1